MVAAIKPKKINVFAVVLNFQQDRFDGNIQRVLRLLREVVNSGAFWDHMVIVYTKCYRNHSSGSDSKIANVRQKIGKKIREVFPEVKNDPPVFFVDSHETNDIPNNNEFTALCALATHKPKFDCSGIIPVPPHEHSWVPVHGEIKNITETRVESHHTGNWGGFAHGWSCCGKGRFNTSWSHNDCNPRSIQMNRSVCTTCDRAPNSDPCSLRCSCGIIKPK